MSWKQTVRNVIGWVLGLLLVPAVALAAQSSSSNYQVNEVFFGTGGELNACGNSYCSKQSAGELTVGATRGNEYQAQSGFNSDRTPYIQFIVNNTNINLGSLSSKTTKTATSSFSVKSYLSHGYTVINASDPPTNNEHTMNALTTPTFSEVGQEQFGINLRANTDPETVGADKVQSPDNSFAFGLVADDYNQVNQFKYAKGNAVAYSTSSTSATTYTVSYLFNISPVTPGGQYEMRHVLVATATF